MKNKSSDKTIGFRAGENLVNEIQVAADKHNVKVSWLIRMILIQWLEESKARKTKRKP